MLVPELASHWVRDVAGGDGVEQFVQKWCVGGVLAQLQAQQAFGGAAAPALHVRLSAAWPVPVPPVAAGAGGGDADGSQ
jgi:hypothetical protein